MAKSSTHFHFKQFSIGHDKCTMKVGTDAVLLGAWANLHNAVSILDIGTGSGVIAIMVAQRSSPTTRIDAVELEQLDANQAHENVLHSPWPEKIKIHHTSIQQFVTERKYDLILSNPPYFINSQEPPDKKRLQTRHTVALNFLDLLKVVKKMLSPDGTFHVILPRVEGLQFIDLALQYELFCTRQWSFRTRKEKPIERWLLEFSFHNTTHEEGEILLYESDTQWSATYKNLTKDFYLDPKAIP